MGGFEIMKKIKLFRVLFLVVLVFCTSLVAQEENESSSLAILVYCEGGNQELAENLQPLIEAEASLQWEGKIVERKEIDKLLDEMKISKSGLADPNAQLQLGKMIHTDCLLTIRVNKDCVKTTMSLFPSTTIIHEKEYKNRLEPQSLSVNIVTNSIKAYREYNRDTNRPQVSIGSFFNAGPFKQYFDFSKNIRIKLRQELLKDKSIFSTERLLPSDLLSEFELARTGITESIARNLSAPPSDILLYGEYKPKPEQDLTKPAAELDFTIFVLSPTGLFENKKVVFSCYSNEPEIPVEKAKQLIEQVSNEIRTKLASGIARIFSEQEFKEFKKQAFRLMPSPPSEDNYYKYQNGTFEELNSAFHMLECAMLFKGDDVQLLVSTGTILYGLSHAKKSNSSVSEERYLKASMEFIERVYLIENNEQITNLYWAIIVKAGKETPSPNYIQAIQHIWDTRNSDNWNERQIAGSLNKLLEYYKDTQQLCRIFLEVADTNKHTNEDITLLKPAFNALISHFHEFKDNPDTSIRLLECSKSLLNKTDIYSRWFGYLLYMYIYAYGITSEQEEQIPFEFIEYFRNAMNILSELQKLHKNEFLSQSNVLSGFFPTYEKALKQYNIGDDSIELKEKFITDKLKVGITGNLPIPSNMMNTLLNYFWEHEEYAHGYELLNQYLKNLSSFSSERYIKERSRFFNAMQEHANFDMNLIEKIELDNNSVKNVHKIISSENGILGIITDKNGSKGKGFRLISTEKIAHIMSEISGEVVEIAISDKYIGIATKKNGFYLLDNQSSNIKNFTPDNSGFPSEYIQSIGVINNNFRITVRGKHLDTYQTYLLDPDTAILNLLDRSAFYQDTQKEIKKNELTLSYQRTNEGVTNIIIINSEGKQLLICEASILSNINDYKLWQGKLIFATNNNLSISEPRSNVVKYFPNKENMIYYCLCVLDDRLYIGTSEGLYFIGAEQFLEMVVKEVE